MLLRKALVKNVTTIMKSQRRSFAHHVPLDSLPKSVTPSKAEVQKGKLSFQNLELAIRSLHQDGLVVVEDVIDHEYLDDLNQIMVKDAYALRQKKDSPYNYNAGNIQQDPPPVLQHFHRSIFLNPIVAQITSTSLGPRPRWTFCSGNTAMPPTPENPPQSQPVHSDADFAHPSHPFALVVNVPLVEMTPENGSTEVWLGTHTDSGLHVQDGLHGDRASGRIKTDVLEERREIRPPCQPVVKKGSVVVRDLRLWHCGRGNHTQIPRVMLALIHFAPWYRNPMRLIFAEDLKSTLEGQNDVEVPVDWVPREAALASYLGRGFGNSYDFGQTA